MQDLQTYSALASIYDDVMYDVDYEVWADFIDDLLQIHHPDPGKLLELACGTGSFALSLSELQCYEILATDKSPQMLEVARKKAFEKGRDNLVFRELDFTDITLQETFDAVILLFDSINYLHDSQNILNLFSDVKQILNKEGIFIFDFTTPKNSLLAIKSLNNESGRSVNNLKYHRKSTYNNENRLHSNEFFIQQWDEEESKILNTYRELHQQKIYTLSEMLELIEQSELQLVAKYSEFNLIEADEDSLRITMVVRC